MSTKNSSDTTGNQTRDPKNKCTVSNAAVNFWETFTCLTGKQYK